MTIFDKLFTKHSVRHSLPSGLRQTEFSVEMRNPPPHINFICQVFILTVSVFLHLPEAYQLSSLVLPLTRGLPFYRKKRETVRRKFVQPLPPDPFTFQIFPPYPLPTVVAEEIPSSNPRFIPVPAGTVDPNSSNHEGKQILPAFPYIFSHSSTDSSF